MESVRSRNAADRCVDLLLGTLGCDTRVLLKCIHLSRVKERQFRGVTRHILPLFNSFVWQVLSPGRLPRSNAVSLKWRYKHRRCHLCKLLLIIELETTLGGVRRRGQLRCPRVSGTLVQIAKGVSEFDTPEHTAEPTTGETCLTSTSWFSGSGSEHSSSPQHCSSLCLYGASPIVAYCAWYCGPS